MKRLETEKPEFFDEVGVSRDELVAHLSNNMCLPHTKLKNKVYRDTAAKIKEKEYLTDNIRRLANQGDRFHPYYWTILLAMDVETLQIAKMKVHYLILIKKYLQKCLCL